MVWLMSASRSSSGKNITFQLPRRSLMIAGIAFGVGVLLFLAVWLGNRNNDFYKAGPAQTPQEVAQVEPLPELVPAILAEFLDGDRAFARRRREQASRVQRLGA